METTELNPQIVGFEIKQCTKRGLRFSIVLACQKWDDHFEIGDFITHDKKSKSFFEVTRFDHVLEGMRYELNCYNVSKFELSSLLIGTEYFKLAAPKPTKKRKVKTPELAPA